MVPRINLRAFFVGIVVLLQKLLDRQRDPIKGKLMKQSTEKCLKEKLSKKHACCVLITCDVPTYDGKMQVEMSYEGDATLAAYILHGAQLHVDGQEIENTDTCVKESKIHYLE